MRIRQTEQAQLRERLLQNIIRIEEDFNELQELVEDSNMDIIQWSDTLSCIQGFRKKVEKNLPYKCPVCSEIFFRQEVHSILYNKPQRPTTPGSLLPQLEQGYKYVCVKCGYTL